VLTDIEKRDAIVAAFKHAWSAYERDAMGSDEYHPITQKGTNLSSAGGIGYTVVDSLDTMLIMGLHEEAARARHWIESDMTFDRDGNFNVFETTIRVLGGLLSAYHLSGNDSLYLEKAVDLADRLMVAFEATATGLPASSVNLEQRVAVLDRDNEGMVSTAEATTLQLEFRYLAELTGKEEYWERAENVMAIVRRATMPANIVSIFMDPEYGQFVPSAIRLGSRGDSYYEYLLKQWLQTNRTEDVYRDMYDKAMAGIAKHLMQRSMANNLLFTAELIPERTYTGKLSWQLVPKQDHLVCFLGGSLMLGATTADPSEPVSTPPLPEELTYIGRRDWKNGVELTRTCMKTHETKTGLSPEIVHFRTPGDEDHVPILSRESSPDWYIKGPSFGGSVPLDARYILRPETVESLFIAWRLTKDARYRRYGWNIFQAIEKHCKIETGGYASVLNVDALPVEHEDKMETFMMSETLKYLFLLFSDDDVLPLDQYVFNTEAHPLPIFNPSFSTGFS